ncbi:hypothetical protein GCM10023310_70710 [Paenibacillus vulneris]|uniref:Uncharacterized protein n=1 Tax=Paenibacillus vulneris TaxID=1133364 RepID=A0ABW3UGS7_9BACL
MYYGDKMEAKINIMEELVNRGWIVYGFTPDQSDSMTDYYSPAHWNGIAEKNGFVLVIDQHGTYYSGYEVKEYNCNNKAHIAYKRIKKLEAMMNDAASTENEKESCKALIQKEKEKAEVKPEYIVTETYPTFTNGNPKGSSWHIEKDGQILAKGNGVFACYVANDHMEPYKSERINKVNSFVNRIEKVLKDSDALQVEVIKVPVTVTKIVEKEIQTLIDTDIKDGLMFIMKVNYTNGIHKGTKYAFTYKDEQFNKYHMFSKLGKRGKASKSMNKSWPLSVDKLNQMLEKGHIAIIEMIEVTEYQEKTVFKKTKRQQKMSDAVQLETLEEIPKDKKNEEHEEINTYKTTDELATSKQLWALHCATKLDTRGANISKTKASELISKSKNGQCIINELKQILGQMAEPENIKETNTQENEDIYNTDCLADVLTDYILANERPMSDEQKTACKAHMVEYMSRHDMEFTEAMKSYMAREYIFMLSIFEFEQKNNSYETTISSEEKSNVIYHDFGKIDQELTAEETAQEEETQTSMFDDILSKFDNVEVTLEKKIPSEDLEFCKTEQKLYNVAIGVFIDIANEINIVSGLNVLTGEWHKDKSSNTYLDSYRLREIKVIAMSIKECFIDKIVCYFTEKYNVTIKKERLLKNYDYDITYTNIIDDIMLQLEGFSFAEKAVKELLDKTKNTYYYNEYKKQSNMDIKNNKIVIDGSYVYKDTIWNQYRLRGDFNEIFTALYLFDNGSIPREETELHSRYCGYQNERNDRNYEKYQPVSLSKVESIKFYKNGKLEIEFKSNQMATKFAYEYLGYRKVSA